jgi:hypothetical protein
MLKNFEGLRFLIDKKAMKIALAPMTTNGD